MHASHPTLRATPQLDREQRRSPQMYLTVPTTPGTHGAFYRPGSAMAEPVREGIAERRAAFPPPAGAELSAAIEIAAVVPLDGHRVSSITAISQLPSIGWLAIINRVSCRQPTEGIQRCARRRRQGV
ncbi:MAG: hypothetical protein O9325_14310 [Roseomonas sp.]|nr:hypothetical protein [Roseomonas sp.]